MINKLTAKDKRRMKNSYRRRKKKTPKEGPTNFWNFLTGKLPRWFCEKKISHPAQWAFGGGVTLTWHVINHRFWLTLMETEKWTAAFIGLGDWERGKAGRQAEGMETSEFKIKRWNRFTPKGEKNQPAAALSFCLSAWERKKLQACCIQEFGMLCWL